MMTTTRSSTAGAFQLYHKPRPILKTTPTLSIDESCVYDRIPCSSVRINSPSTILKSMSIPSKRRSSAMSLTGLFPRRKSLQTTALTTRRQSLWMSIAKNPSISDDVQTAILPLQPEPSSLIRKKILRILLVISYLISISLFAIALATFYGFFWSGYSRIETSTVLNVRTSVRSLISLTSNSTVSQKDDVIREELFHHRSIDNFLPRMS